MMDPEIGRFLRDQCREIAELFWPATPGEQLGTRIDRLDAELARRQAGLLRYRQKIEKVRHRLELLSRPMPSSASDAGSSKASEPRLQRLDRLRGRLLALEQAYSGLLARFERRKRQRAAFREALLSRPTSEGDEIGSDSDQRC